MTNKEEPNYIFSSNYAVIKADDLFDSDFVERENLISKYVIISKLTKRFFLINESIKSFLEFFREPITLKDVINNIAVQEKYTKNDIEERVNDFFNSMQKRGIIVKHGNKENDLSIDKQEEFFIEGYKILKYFKQRPNLIICLAEDIQTNQQVVLKCLLVHKIKAERKEKVQREFIQEFKIMKEVNNHPFICKVDSFNEDKMIAILEYIEGTTLKDFVRENNLSLDSKLLLIEKILNVFSYLHETKVLHGDIHASNFIVNNNLDLKLIDFGLSNHENPNDNEIIRTGGVFCYIPPERISYSAFKIVNENAATYKSEVYQLSVLIYFVIYGKTPHDALLWKKLVEAIQNNPISFDEFTNNNEKVPVKIINLLNKGLDKDPDNRYTTAKELYLYWHTCIKNLHSE